MVAIPASRKRLSTLLTWTGVRPVAPAVLPLHNQFPYLLRQSACKIRRSGDRWQRRRGQVASILLLHSNNACANGQFGGRPNDEAHTRPRLASMKPVGLESSWRLLRHRSKIIMLMILQDHQLSVNALKMETIEHLTAATHDGDGTIYDHIWPRRPPSTRAAALLPTASSRA